MSSEITNIFMSACGVFHSEESMRCFAEAFFRNLNALWPRARYMLYRNVEVSRADIRVEDINGPVLLLSGDADTCVPADWVCEQVVKRLKDNGFKYPYIHHNYEYLSHYVIPFRTISNSFFKEERKYKKECSEGRKKSWNDTLRFLSEKWV